MKTEPKAMFLDTLQIEADKDLVHLGLMDAGPDGGRPEVDGQTLSITIPLSQLGPVLKDLADACVARTYSGAYAKR